MLYRVLFDANRYRLPLWDQDQIARYVSDDDIEHLIDMNGAPISHKGVFPEPLKMSFEPRFPGDKKLEIPDIAILEGRLYLNAKALQVLKPLLEADGEFLDLVDERGEPGALFTPMHVAEDVEAIDWNKTVLSDWAGFEHLSFHENKVHPWRVFRTRKDGYQGLFCQEDPVVKAIRQYELTGAYITEDLASIHPIAFSEVASGNIS
ncbi:hypothetical protein [Marinimicrobium locisalis]|uniref:hypothetical protein n=1 Tax=Marinimicrobium locisalis TaxID=546022 RepID=UPI0032218D03